MPSILPIHNDARFPPPLKSADSHVPECLQKSKFELKILAHSPIYQSLQAVKNRCNHDRHVSAEFDQRRKRYQFDTPQTSFRDQFESIFTDINLAVRGLFAENNVHVFLDLGCAPGGFSKFILDNNPHARGMGITLPSIPMVLDGSLANEDRYRLEKADLTLLNFDARCTKFRPPSARINLEKNGYDLIVAGAFPTGQHISLAARAILALSQLHAILCNLQPGATCVVVANTKTFMWNVEMFAVLRRVFGRIEPAKHSELHAIRSSCYFVCTGFDPKSVELLSLKTRVKFALDKLKVFHDEETVSKYFVLFLL